jgi:hypothetical protein
MPVLINTLKCTSAQICTAFESYYLAIFGQIARKCCANSGRRTPDTYRASSVQHLHCRMLANINGCYPFTCCAFPDAVHSRNFVSIVLFLPFLKKVFFHGSSFTMSTSTANIAKKKVVTVIPTTLDNASISDVVLVQVFDKVSHKPTRVDGKLVTTNCTPSQNLICTRLSVLF